MRRKIDLCQQTHLQSCCEIVFIERMDMNVYCLQRKVIQALKGGWVGWGTLTEVLTKESGCRLCKHGICNTPKKWLLHIVMILNCIIRRCSPSVYSLFPISYRRPKTELSVVLPVCTVSIAVRAMCKCCGTFLNVILIPIPCLLLTRCHRFAKPLLDSSYLSVCLSVCLSAWKNFYTVTYDICASSVWTYNSCRPSGV